MNSLSEVLVIGLEPSLYNKGISWFKENTTRIKEATKKDGFWRNSTFILSANQKISPGEVVRIFDELGYEKVFEVQKPGQFSARGGLIDIFPINEPNPIKIEFFGNVAERLMPNPSRFSEPERERFLKNKFLKDTSLLKNLKEGEYVVHLDHGIGLYQGRTKSKDDPNQEYLTLEYAAPRPQAVPDRLFVPIRQIKKITRYLGFKTPVLHRLGSQIWEQTKTRAKETVFKLARELLELYAQREIIRRAPYPLNRGWEEELEAGFTYEETPDQLSAVEDIKRDLTSEKPMDRLICGDVGFGKTEVALRSAIMVAATGRQVALLAPTTILADQHFNTFQKRLQNFPVKVALMTRLETKQKQLQVIRQLQQGAIDIVIGTHRLLSSDTKFKNLGLLIIDEEQRFGVKQKERLKQLKTSLDVLSLSATPIPRTLKLILSGLKPVSLIQTAPAERLPIKTFIEPFELSQVKEALENELKRKGQIFWLHNRIETLSIIEDKIQSLLPRLKIAMVHGRLNEKQLRQVMNDFREGKKQLLLATTIIENGLDLTNVNTLIVDDATRLGLAQAHQLRGRIGRTDVQAYAYFFYPHQLTPQAKQRLEALKEYQFLGAGFEIAKKDLEIRGAGNILGHEQSGALNQLGLNLYCQMLAQVVEELSQGKIHFEL